MLKENIHVRDMEPNFDGLEMQKLKKKKKKKKKGKLF